MDVDEVKEIDHYICSNPHCEQRIYFKDVIICEVCGNPYCPNCKDQLYTCINCGLKICDYCAERDDNHDYVCQDCKEE